MGKIDILKIAKQAQAHKKEDSNVIDATIGMFYNDQQELIIPDVAKAFHQLDLLETFKYGATDGGREFEENILNWILDEKREKLANKFLFTGVSTPGGSGALSMVFNSYGSPGEKALVSDLRWRYDYFLKSAKMDVHEHKLFDGDKFDLTDFEKQLAYLTTIQKRVIVVINDPCHNPSGYQLSKDEWINIVKILNQFNQNEIILTYDLAYFDYDPRGFSQARVTFDYLMDLEKHVQVLICFSASKSFAIYGVRLGGLVGLHHTKDQYDFFKKDVLDDALGKWSTAPSVGVGIFNQLAGKKADYVKELTKLTSTLKNRGEIFIKEAIDANLEVFPYRGGFFVLVKSKDPETDFIKLTQEKIYLIPMESGLRIALCAITTKEVYGLAGKIKAIINP